MTASSERKLYEKIKKIAKKEGRTVQGTVKIYLEEKVKEATKWQKQKQS